MQDASMKSKFLSSFISRLNDDSAGTFISIQDDCIVVTNVESWHGLRPLFLFDRRLIRRWQPASGQ